MLDTNIGHVRQERAGYTIEEVRGLLGGVSRQTVYNLITAGHLRTFKIGRRRLASPAAVAECVRRLERLAG